MTARYSPVLDELLDEEHVLLRVLRDRERHPLVPDPPGQQGQKRNVPQEPEVGLDEESHPASASVCTV